MPIREKEYVKPLGAEARRRLWLAREGKKVVDYLVQLEIEMEPDEWKPVVRYDTRHGGPHRDQYKISGEKDKEKFLNVTFDILTGYQDAVRSAEQDIEKNWRFYCQRFLRGEWPAT